MAVAMCGSPQAHAGETDTLSLDRWLRGRVGVNHRVGDAGFLAAEGRMPGPGDDEHVRMRDHLGHVRDVLARAPATSEARARMRRALIAHLDSYIARGVTPENTHFGFRTPVFIDDAGRICAVGYLIEQTAGRAIAEDIARTHRYAELEAIYRDRADVRSWVEASGFTLEELASIQPGYIAAIDDWHPWSIEDGRITSEPDRAADDSGMVTYLRRVRGDDDDTTTTPAMFRGALVDGSMVGPWTFRETDGSLRGSGTFRAGSGSWRSLDASGRRMAEGPYEQNLPHGTWRLYHPSGRIAAQGAMAAGRRVGPWTFYHDDPGGAPLARGGFDGGDLRGRWNHYDEKGHLLAIYTEAVPPVLRKAGWIGPEEGTSGIAHLVTVTPGSDGVSHSRSFAMEYMNTTQFALDMYAREDLKLFVHAEPVEPPNEDRSLEMVMKDDEGRKLERHEKGASVWWTERVCPFSDARRAAAKAGDIVTLNGLWVHQRKDGTFENRRTRGCGPATATSPERARGLEVLYAHSNKVRALTPAFVKQFIVEQEHEHETDSGSGSGSDFAELIVGHASWYVEWPHIDGRFLALFPTLPGMVSSR